MSAGMSAGMSAAALAGPSEERERLKLEPMKLPAVFITDYYVVIVLSNGMVYFSWYDNEDNVDIVSGTLLDINTSDVAQICCHVIAPTIGRIVFLKTDGRTIDSVKCSFDKEIKCITEKQTIYHSENILHIQTSDERIFHFVITEENGNSVKFKSENFDSNITSKVIKDRYPRYTKQVIDFYPNRICLVGKDNKCYVKYSYICEHNRNNLYCNMLTCLGSWKPKLTDEIIKEISFCEEYIAIINNDNKLKIWKINKGNRIKKYCSLVIKKNIIKLKSIEKIFLF